MATSPVVGIDLPGLARVNLHTPSQMPHTTSRLLCVCVCVCVCVYMIVYECVAHVHA